jgi:hypothetical protein
MSSALAMRQFNLRVKDAGRHSGCELFSTQCQATFTVAHLSQFPSFVRENTRQLHRYPCVKLAAAPTQMRKACSMPWAHHALLVLVRGAGAQQGMRVSNLAVCLQSI